MGFGLLFIGYFFANMMSFFELLYFAKIIGYPLMILGLFHLAHYHDRFKYCFYASFASAPFAIYFALCKVPQLFGTSLPGAVFADWFFNGVNIAYQVYSILLQLLLLFAVAGLTKELKLINLQSNAYRNMISFGLYAVLLIVSHLPFKFAAYVYAPTMFLRLVIVLLNMWLIFKCYRHICPEGENTALEPLEKRPTKRRIQPEDEDESDESEGSV